MFTKSILNYRSLFILRNWHIANYKLYRNRLTIKPIIKKSNHQWGKKYYSFLYTEFNGVNKPKINDVIYL